MDYKQIASDWLRSIRGPRSQVAFNRQLGYRSNVAYRWEAGRAFPTAARTFAIVDRLGGDVQQALRRFLGRAPAWIGKLDPGTSEGLVVLLAELRGTMTISELTRHANISRFRLSRWLNGHAEPTLPEFLCLVQATTLRLLDFLACFVDPAELPSVKDEWRRLEQARKTAYDTPWSHAVLRCLEIADYRALPVHEPGFIARRIGLTLQQEEECLALLHASGQIRWVDDHWQIERSEAVATRTDPERTRPLRAWWTQVGLDRLKEGKTGVFSYNLFSVSERDLQRLEQLHRAYYQQLSQIIAGSEPAECVALFATQLLRLDE